MIDRLRWRGNSYHITEGQPLPNEEWIMRWALTDRLMLLTVERVNRYADENLNGHRHDYLLDKGFSYPNHWGGLATRRADLYVEHPYSGTMKIVRRWNAKERRSMESVALTLKEGRLEASEPYEHKSPV